MGALSPSHLSPRGNIETGACNAAIGKELNKKTPLLVEQSPCEEPSMRFRVCSLCTEMGYRSARSNRIHGTFF